MAELQAHEFSDTFPAMADFDFQELAADIKKQGLLDPITLYEGAILDGRHRHRACLKVKVKPHFFTFEGTREEALAYSVSKNGKRRHQSPESLAFSGANAAKKFAAEAEKRQKAGTLASAEAKGKATEKAAEAIGISRASIERAAKIEEHADPKIVEAAKAGEVSLTDAAKVAELPKKEQRDALKAVQAGEAKTLAAAVENMDSEPPPEVIAKPAKPGKPKVDVRKFADLESKVGAVVRANTALKDHCGGAHFHEQIRQHLNGILKEIKAWRKDKL